MTNIEIFGIPYLKKGSGIHIKKKNRGKFTEYCGGEVTDKCIQKAKKSKNPTLRKRATFAENARAWKHEHGGILKCQEGTTKGGLVSKFQQPWRTLQTTRKKDPIATVKERLYKNISPSGYYSPFKRLWNALVKNTPEKFDIPEDGLNGRELKQNPKENLSKLQAHNPYGDYFMHKGLENDLRNALWAKYLGLTDEQVGFKISDYIEESPYKPPHAKEGEVYYRINPNLVKVLHQDKLVEIVPNKKQIPNPYKKDGIVGWFQPDTITKTEWPKDELGGFMDKVRTGEIPVGFKGLAKGWGLGTYTVGTGQDETGTYSSYYDEWDINPFKGSSAEVNIPFLSKIEDISIIGTPIKLYDRVYHNQMQTKEHE